MREISLTQGYVTIIDDEDFEIFNLFTWCAAKMHGKVYAMRQSLKSEKRNKSVYLHREILNCDKNKVIDHINGDTLDNRKTNLRTCLQSDNMKNRKINKNNTSGYKGVNWYPNHSKWVAKIGVAGNGKKIHLGYFDTAELAAEAYNKASLIYHGEFGRINKIKGE